jgi:prepilin-type N-terminal cleavage/methylation domain-containing protein
MGMRFRNHRRSSRMQRPSISMLGFSMVEMMIVIALMLVVSGIAVVNTQSALKDSRVAGGYENALMQLRMARQRAIEERKRYIVTFGTPAPTGASTPLGAPTAKSIQLFRWDAGNPSPAPVQVSTIDLPSDVSFAALPGLPTGSSAVPDGFGSGITAIDFDQGVGAGSGNLVMFMPDGSGHDLAGNSDNGILYIARTGELSSSRAITVFGNSGRIRGWRLVQPGGVAAWQVQ